MPHREGAATAPDYWDGYRAPAAADDDPPPPVDGFSWTQWGRGHGPGAEVLGTPRSALELGCARGVEAVALARTGVRVTAVDFSSGQIARARRWWAEEPGLEFVQSEAGAYLTAADRTWDAVFDLWAALWHTDPAYLLPLIRLRLAPGGVLAFSHAEPLAHGPQVMYANSFRGRRLAITRWMYSPEEWEALLLAHGFTDVRARVLPAPDPRDLGTLLVRATADG